MNPDDAEVHAAADDRGVVVGGDDHDRHARILRAQVEQAGKAPHPRHGEVEQDQVDVAATVEELGNFVERPRLGNVDALEQPGDCLAQRPAE